MGSHQRISFFNGIIYAALNMDTGQGIKNWGVVKKLELQTCHTFACSQSQVKAENGGGDWRQGLREPEAATGFVHV